MTADEARTFERISATNIARVTQALDCGCTAYLEA